MFRCSLILAIASIAGHAVAGDSGMADVDFLLLGNRGTVKRITFAVEIDGKPHSAVWDDALAELMTYYDDDRNGELSPAEAKRLPAPFMLRQTLWNPVSQFGRGIPSTKDLDADGDERITRRELVGWYRERGVGGVTVGAGLAPSSAALTSAILQVLDLDHNQAVSAAEWKNAPAALSALDVNSDEMISPQELLPRLNYPGTSGAHLWGPIKPLTDQHSVIRDLPLRLAAQLMDVELNIPTESSRKQEVTADAHTLRVNLSRSSPPTTATVAADDVRVSIRSDEGVLRQRIETAARRLRTRFQAADADSDSCSDAAETKRKDQADLRALVDAADHYRDGRITVEELNTWIKLQEKLAAGQVLITILDFRRGVFEILDANADGRLSPRELGSTEENVQEFYKEHPDTFDPASVPRQVRVIISRGRPQTVLVAVRHDAPEWFRAMDRNQDGDVSSREFIGDPTAFQRLDRDGDRLISPDEIDQH